MGIVDGEMMCMKEVRFESSKAWICRVFWLIPADH